MNQRKVRPQGIILWRQDWIFISSALAGWSVGLEAARTGKWKIWFGRLQLGELDEAAWTFIPSGKEN